MKDRQRWAARRSPAAQAGSETASDLQARYERLLGLVLRTGAWLEAVPKSFRTLAGYRSGAVTLQRGDGAVRAPAASVTGGFFPMLGITAWRGRLFSDDDLKAGAAPVTVLSYSAWQSRFNGEDDAIAAAAAVPIAPSSASARCVPPSVRRGAADALNSPHQSSSRTVGQTPSIR